jgi:hypothetical protein
MWRYAQCALSFYGTYMVLILHTLEKACLPVIAAPCLFVTLKKLVSHCGNELITLSGLIIKMLIVVKLHIGF